jgi:hypothetical protein
LSFTHKKHYQRKTDFHKTVIAVQKQRKYLNVIKTLRICKKEDVLLGHPHANLKGQVCVWANLP